MSSRDSVVPRTAIVPAAGLGTRFLPATKRVPKELLPVVDTPGIELVAAEAAAAGAQRLVIITLKDKEASSLTSSKTSFWKGRCSPRKALDAREGA